MASRLSLDTIDLVLHPSSIVGALSVLVALLALVALYLAPLDLALQLSVGLAICLSGYHHLVHASLLVAPRAVRRITFRGGQWWLVLRDARIVPASLLPETVVIEHLIVARFVGADGVRYPVALLPDSLGPGEHRRARMFFRYISRSAAE